MKRKVNPYRDGAEAFEAGRPRENPPGYDEPDGEAQWFDGWDDARRLAERHDKPMSAGQAKRLMKRHLQPGTKSTIGKSKRRHNKLNHNSLG